MRLPHSAAAWLAHIIRHARSPRRRLPSTPADRLLMVLAACGSGSAHLKLPAVLGRSAQYGHARRQPMPPLARAGKPLGPVYLTPAVAAATRTPGGSRPRVVAADAAAPLDLRDAFCVV